MYAVWYIQQPDGLYRVTSPDVDGWSYTCRTFDDLSRRAAERSLRRYLNNQISFSSYQVTLEDQRLARQAA